MNSDEDLCWNASDAVVQRYLRWIQMSHEKKPSYFPLCWLFDRDPYTSFIVIAI